MRILVGMSGGVDSTYAAMKLRAEGHEVVGAVLIMHDYTDTEAAADAARRVGIPLVRVDCREAFSNRIVEYFIDEYTRGRTPNPCIVCNREVKFRYLYDYATANGFERIATGHYARVVKVADGAEERYTVARARDLTKDQTYMLYRLPQQILSILMLPMGDELKEQVKEKAERLGITEEGQKESQEICFIPDNDYAGYIERSRGKSPEGSFVDKEGNILGKHKGIIHYTVGQRKGLGISLGERVFVAGIDSERNEILLSREGSATDTVTVSDSVYSGMCEPAPGESMAVTVKVRYLAPPIEAVWTSLGDGRAEVKLSAPVRSVAPGQSLVAYDGDRVLVGGFIDRSE